MRTENGAGRSPIGQGFSRQRRKTRSGAHSVALLSLLAALGAGCDGESEQPLEPAAGERAAEPRPSDLAPPITTPDTGHTEAAAPRDATRDTLRKLRDPNRFRGTGSIRGRLGLPRGSSPGEPWTVTVSPSQVLAGSEHAVKRRIEIPADRNDFEIEDLPLGGYDLRAHTRGFGSRAIAVQLERGAEHPVVQVALEPRGPIHGVLVDEDGDPVEGRRVHVRLRRTGEVRTTQSRTDGVWSFDSADQGSWTLIVGPLERPMVEKDFDNVGARSSNLGRQVLPVTTTLEIHVHDEFQTPVPGAQVLGYSDRGGSFELEADDRGVAVAEFVPFGEWTVTAVADDGRRAREVVPVESKDQPRVYVDLPR